MAITSTDGRFLVVNPKLCSLLGHRPGDLASSGLFDITHPEDWSNVAKALADLTRDARDQFTQRQRCLAAGGALIWVDLTVSATPGRGGLALQYLVQFIDVTGRSPIARWGSRRAGTASTSAGSVENPEGCGPRAARCVTQAVPAPEALPRTTVHAPGIVALALAETLPRNVTFGRGCRSTVVGHDNP